MIKNTLINWKNKHFSELSAREWYDIAKIRMEIFIIEQNCIYLDLDDKDLDAIHIYGKQKGKIIAYTRLLAKNISYPEISIGRVVVDKEYRGQKLGDLLMKKTLEVASNKYPLEAIRISAQEHLKNFYKKHGFKVITNPYLEDGIPHVGMLRK